MKSCATRSINTLDIGMLLTGADDDMLRFAKNYAVNLGMAFQLQDDLMDMNEDLKTGQNSLITWYIQQKGLSEKQSKQFAQESIETYFAKAEEAIFDHNKTGEEIKK